MILIRRPALLASVVSATLGPLLAMCVGLAARNATASPQFSAHFLSFDTSIPAALRPAISMATAGPTSWW